jgi:hypothetical protein
MIDLDAPAESSASRRLLEVVRSGRARRSRQRAGFEAAGVEAGLESTGLESAATEAPPAEPGAPKPPAERVSLLQEAIQRGQETARPEDRPDPALAAEVLEGARSGLAKAQESNPLLTRREEVGLEAVILTDGTRPSLSVRAGFVDLTAPDIGDWDAALRHFEATIRRVIAAVGRVNVPAGQGFAGTCFVVAPDLVVTNRHVLEEIASEQPAGTWTLKFPGQTTVDFIGEEGATTGTQIPVLGVAFAGPDPINRRIHFPNLDVALLRVDPSAVASFPSPVGLEKDLAPLGPSRELYAVGFPARPGTHFGTSAPSPGTETAEVMGAVFGWQFGVKKLAPGAAVAVPGELANDSKKWVFTHNASTLGGNSGSCIVDLGIDGARVIGIHFGGLARDENWAHSFAAVKPNVDGHGLTFV